VAVENVPFEYALPMLTGWALGYGIPTRGCDDEHIAELGVWIDAFQYEKTPAAPAGTLRYTISAILRDDNGLPGYFDRHKVSVLGLRATAAAQPGRPAPRPINIDETRPPPA
jgi:hypothetical protein